MEVEMTQGQDDNFRADRHADEDLVPFDVRDYSGRRAMLLLITAVVLLLAAAFFIFRLYQTGVRDRSAPPRIAADNTPYKVAPENPGGVVTPNQDKTVYDVMNGTVKNEQVTTAPAPENPIDLPRQATIIVDSTDTDIPKAKPAAPAPSQRSTPAQTQSGGSDYVVQVASVRIRADTDRLWSGIQRRFQSILPAGTYADVTRVDLNEKGIYYRLRVAGLADKTAASQLCKRFEASGQACFVTRR